MVSTDSLMFVPVHLYVCACVRVHVCFYVVLVWFTESCVVCVSKCALAKGPITIRVHPFDSPTETSCSLITSILQHASDILYMFMF